MKKIKYKIRPAKMEEAKELTALAKRSKAYWGYSEEWIETWEDQLTVTPEMIHDFVAYVAEYDGKIKGFWCRSVKEANDSSPSRGLLFVEPEAIGTGCGRQLWEAVKSTLIKKGVKSFIFEADPNAVSFYIKMGAQKIGEKESPVIPGRKIPILKFDLTK